MPTTRRAPAFKCPPQLPRNIRQELSRNSVVAGNPVAFSQGALDEFRYNIALRAIPADHIADIEYEGTLLQLAATVGDLPLAYEMIRLGANVDTTDTHELTSLFHAVLTLTNLDFQTGQHLMYSAPNDPGLHNPSTGPRIKLVIALLLEQHADVNVVTNNVTCFTVLMRAKFKHWDIIELLIAHGARDDLGSLNGLVLSKEEKKHISELLRTRPSKRPPRPCPCFSRRLLSDCHGKGPKAFPCHFICPCQSGVAYAKCCKKRDIAWREVWNGEQGIIEPWRKDRPVDLPLPMHTTTLLSKLRKETGRPSPPTEMLRRLTDVPLAVDQIGLPPEMPVNGMVLLEIHLNVLLERGLLDPGFVFAVKKASWNARPLGRKIPKKYATDLAQGFNKHVDEYINSGLDSRKAMEIEMASKLGPSCGALYRVCEAQGCKEQEGRRLIKLKYCQKCRMAVYCSLRCQRAHWKVHKTVCCAPFQTEQPLSSQRELQESLSQSFMEVCSILIQQIQDNEPNLIPQLFPEGIPEDYAIEEELAKEFDTLTTREILEKFGFLE